jgi:hypothetical protein
MKQWLLAVFILGALLPTSKVCADDESRIQCGFEITPVPLNLEGKNRALVGLGSYIVNAQGAVMIATPICPTRLAEIRIWDSRS